MVCLERVTMTGTATKSKELAEMIARNLRCSGVSDAYVQRVTMYEVAYLRDDEERNTL